MEGRLSWGHRLEIHNAAGDHVGTVQEEILTLLPRFALEINGQYIGQIKKEFTLFRPSFTLDCNGWTVQGDWFEWDYQVLDPYGQMVATVSKELLRWTDTYVIDLVRPEDALICLMIVLAIDAVKCDK